MSRGWSVYYMPGHRDAETVWGVTVAGVSFHARTDAGTSVLHSTMRQTAWLKLKDQHCLSDNINN